MYQGWREREVLGFGLALIIRESGTAAMTSVNGDPRGDVWEYRARFPAGEES